MERILLIPTPRRLDRSGPGCRLTGGISVSGAPDGLAETIPGLDGRSAGTGLVRCTIDPRAVSASGDEAYHLRVGADGVRIAARTATGLRWGLATLAQVRRSCGDDLPGLVVDDAPAIRERGFMLDVARDRVPTMASLRELVDRMAGLKLNHLQLYNEHAFAYAGHEAVWRNADPVTPAEMRDLDAYAAARGVALAANQNTLGHFERWLRHPDYLPLAELGAPWLFPAWGNCWMEPNTLCPTDPRSLALVEDLLAQQLACCSGGYANIGGDEPVDLGMGRSRDACASLGERTVFSRYLAKVADRAVRLGKRPQFWCDDHPADDPELPAGLVALLHGYDPGFSFAQRIAAHRAAGREVWVAPGTNSWCTYAGRTTRRRGNLARAAAEAVAHGAHGLLNTDWGDLGHRQQWPLTLLGMADGAAASWQGGATGWDDRAAGLHALGCADSGPWLAGVGTVEDGLKRGYGAPTFTDGNTPWGNDAETETTAAYAAIASNYAEAEASLPAIGGLVEDECRLAVRLARLAAERAVARRRSTDPAVRTAFAGKWCQPFAEYRRLWLARSRYGGLEDSYAKLRAVLA